MRTKTLKRKLIAILAVLVVFVTVYSLVLPATALTGEAADNDPGINIGSVDNETQNETVTKEIAETVEENKEEKTVTDEKETLKFYGEAGDSIVYVEAPYDAFPEGTTIEVKEVILNSEQYDSINDQIKDKEVKVLKALDITFRDKDNNEIEPKDNSKVKVSITAKELSEIDNAFVAHIDEKEDVPNIIEDVETKKEDVEVLTNTEEITEIVENNDAIDEITVDNTVTFETDSFSLYVLAYTVDFHLDGVDYSIPGNSQILLSELIEIMDIKDSEGNRIDVNNVESVEFSDEHLVSVEEVSGVISYNGVEGKDVGDKDFLLTSLEPFDSNEKLTITLNNGELIKNEDSSEIIQVEVTDEGYISGNGYITSLELYSDGNKIDGSSWNVFPNVEYELKLFFAEKGANQLVKGKGLEVTLPSGVSLVEGDHGTFIIDAGPAGSIINNTYRVENGKLYIDFGDDPSDIITESSNVKFNAFFKVKFNGSSGELSFNDSASHEYNVNNDHDITVNKNGQYNQSTNTIDYELNVNSIGTNNDVKISDIIDGDTLSLESNTIEVFDKNGNKLVAGSDYSIDVQGNKFDLSVASMSHGDSLKIKYSASVDLTQLGSDGKIVSGEKRNTVQINDVEKTHFDFDNVIHYSDISKSSTRYDSDNNLIEWKIIANQSKLSNIVGATISDSIEWNSKEALKYAKNDGTAASSGDQISLTLVVTDNSTPSNSKTINDVHVTVNEDSNGIQSWSYIIPDTAYDGLLTDKKYSYEFTYKTVVDSTKVPSDGFVKNNTNNDKGGSDSGSQYIGGGSSGDEIAASKTTKTVTDEYIDWDIVINIPAEGYNNKFEVVETIPHYNHLKDSFVVPDSCLSSVTGLVNDEACKIVEQTITEGSYEYEQLKFIFYQNQIKTDPGLDAVDGGRTITISLRTLNSLEWMTSAESQGAGDPAYSHTNNATVYADSKFKNVEATGIPVRSRVIKGKQGDQEIEGLPAYYYTVALSNITSEPVVITDTFDGSLLEYVKNPGWDAYKVFFGNASNANESVSSTYTPNENGGTISGNGNSLSVVLDSSNEGQLTITANNLPKKDDGSFYSFYIFKYYLKVKNSNALEVIKQRALENGGSYLLTNNAGWNNVSDSFDVEYSVNTISKDGFFYNEDINGINNRIYDFVIDINPDKLLLNNNEDLVLVDSHTPNLSINYSTISVFKVTGSYSAQDLKDALKLIAKKEIDSTYTYQDWEQTKVDNYNNRVGFESDDTVEWNFNGNEGTFTGIKDSTHYLISYQALVLGGGTQSISNQADLEGFISTKNDQRWYQSGASGSADVFQIQLLKYEKGTTSRGLSGAVFQLFEEGDEPNTYKPMKYGAGDKVGQDITFTTDSKGYVMIKLNQTNDGAELKENKKYFIKEIQSPAGYIADNDIYYQFELTTDSSKVNYGGYVDNVRQWIYYSYNDILKVANVSSKLDLTVEKIWKENNQVITPDSSKEIQYKVMQNAYSDSGLSNLIAGYPKEYPLPSSVTGKLNSSNNWTETISQLPKVGNGDNDSTIYFSYYVVESPNSYGYDVIYRNGSDVSSSIASEVIANMYSSTDTIEIINNKNDVNISVLKIDSESSLPLSGAVFKIYRKSNENSWILLTSDELDCLSDDNTITTGSDGKFTVSKLFDGVFRLEEVQAPSGYVITKQYPVVFTVNNGTITISDELIVYVPTTNTFTVSNEPGNVLPMTGGSGISIMVMSGLGLMSFATIIYFIKMSHKERRNN